MDITIFGWKRDHLKNYINDCEKISEYLSEKNNRIYTGGGGGFMLAANKGCYKINKKNSFAISVKVLYGNEGENNDYYPNENLTICETFAERKDILIMQKDLFIIFPGGIGTLDEFTELINLMKTNSIEKKPVILYGSKFWDNFKKWCNNEIHDYYPEEYITCIVDNVDEFKKYYEKNFSDF